MDYVLKTDNLTKFFKKKPAVNKVSMNVPKGAIYGLIGINGAGKTTIMRMVAGLAAPSGGSIELFGSKDLVSQRQKLGCVIENPALYPNMTARENLEAFRKLAGIQDDTLIDSILDTVGLKDVDNKKKAKNFSLGMKQRLSIGIALIGDPEFLILDEPINGLDPTGIAEMRDLFIKLRDQGKTILISSHILGELFKVATHFGVIKNGVLITEFEASALDDKCQTVCKFVVNDTEKAKQVLADTYNATDVKIEDANTLLVGGYNDDIAKLNASLCSAGIEVSHVSLQGQDLESYFIGLMRGGAV